MIVFIAAHDQNFAIGNKGHLPWRHARMQDDTKRLHKLANGKTLVMGERTYHDYRDVRRAFSTDKVIVISRSLQTLPDAEVVNDIEEIITRAQQEELWVIGGGSIFLQLLPYVDIMYLTQIEHLFSNADTFFPKYNKEDWNVVEEQTFPADARNPFPFTFLTLQRRSKQ